MGHFLMKNVLFYIVFSQKGGLIIRLLKADNAVIQKLEQLVVAFLGFFVNSPL